MNLTFVLGENQGWEADEHMYGMAASGGRINRGCVLAHQNSSPIPLPLKS